MKFGLNVQKTKFACFSFSCRFAFFINFSSFKLDTKNNDNFDSYNY